MAFIGFDLDETIGRFMAPYFHTFFLLPNIYYRLHPDQEPEDRPPAETIQKIRNAFGLFVRCLSNHEMKSGAVGLLRPGILMIMGHLASLKQQGRVKGILIYSNNGNLACLYLATRLIEEILGISNLFCKIIDRYDAIRDGEGKNYGDPENPIKSAKVLREAFATSPCVGVRSIANVPVEKLIFFDDREHPDLLEKLGPERYFKVSPYGSDMDMKVIDACFEMAMRESGLAEDKLYFDYIAPILAEFNLESNLESIFVYLNKVNSDYVPHVEEFADDTMSIMERLNALLPPLPPHSESGANKGSVDPEGVGKGGRRRVQRKRRITRRLHSSAGKKQRRGKRSTRNKQPKKLTRSAA